jgi:hypothetical protein
MLDDARADGARAASKHSSGGRTGMCLSPGLTTNHPPSLVVTASVHHCGALNKSSESSSSVASTLTPVR